MDAPDLLSDLQWRHLVVQTTDAAALGEELASGQVSLYSGFDPTAPSLHVGHLIQALALRHFQLAGHRPIALVGGATGLIGDPRPTSERQLNDPETVAAWVERIRAQLAPLLDFEGPGAALMVDNLEWLGRMDAMSFLRDIGKNFRVSRMLEKEAVKARLGVGEGISYTEFSYQLLQATDFLELYRRYGCRLQTGGSDQWGNLTAGLDLVHKVERESLHAVATPLITKADGTKFGKTEGGAVWLDAEMTSPYAFYQFFLNTEDVMVSGYLRQFTFLPREELEDLEARIAEAPQRREAQRRLAEEVTRMLHGDGALAAVTGASKALFGTGDLRELDRRTLLDATAELPRVVLAPGAGVAEALAGSGLSPSRSAARRSIAEGAVSVNNVKVATEDEVLGAQAFLHGSVAVLRRGRKSLAAVVAPDAEGLPQRPAAADAVASAEALPAG